MPLYANIILPVPIQKLFTYSVPPHLHGQLATGSRAPTSMSALICLLYAIRRHSPLLALTSPRPVVCTCQRAEKHIIGLTYNGKCFRI